MKHPIPKLSDLEQRVKHAIEILNNVSDDLARLHSLGDDEGSILWRDDIRAALNHLGGRASLDNIYREVKNRRRAGGRSWPEKAEAAIRETLQAHCTDSPQYEAGPDLFRHVGRGEWRLATHRDDDL
jgi:hypothetical protein